MGNLQPADLKLSSVPGAIVEAHGLPQPQWDTIVQWMEDNVPPEQADEVWAEFELQWLEGLGDVLGPEYSMYRLGRTLLLSPQSDGEATDLVRFADRAWNEINDFFAELVPEDEGSSVVVIVFDDNDKYDNYLSCFPEEDHQSGSTGSAIWAGHDHVAMVDQLLASDLEATVAAGFAKLYLQPMDLPTWLDNGAAALAISTVIEGIDFRPGSDMPAEELDRWRQRGIANFWSGDSFSSMDEEQTDSYRLAELLVRLILWDHKKDKLIEFLEEADPDDCGEAAAKKLLGRGLGDFIAEMLGPGDWSPG